MTLAATLPEVVVVVVVVVVVTTVSARAENARQHAAKQKCRKIFHDSPRTVKHAIIINGFRAKSNLRL